MTDIDQVLEQALAHAEEGDWSAAEKLLRDELEKAPEDPRLLCWLGVAQQELGLSSLAYDTFRRCISTQPVDPHVLAIAGYAIARLDDPDAEPALRLAAITAPDLPIARWSYGAYLAREGLLDDALRELDAASGLAPDDPHVAVERGGALALKGEFGVAAHEFQRAVTLTPDDGWPRILLGLVLLELRRWEPAATALVEGARLRGADAGAQVLAALAAAAWGWLDIAEEMIERARVQAVGADRALVREAERTIAHGGRGARSLLMTTVAPGALRERLMAWE
ncbi:MAG: tetratricopeptide repeat protein [Gemmatimonadetes bacterium]|nr:tetratricopeptide repeat protein [Gemmatimonadota bacterium]